MALVSDNFHKKKLNKYGINIKTKYIVGNNIFERNTDDSYNDDIKDGIRCSKEYYVNNQLKHTENKFDSRIEYTFISNEEDKEQVCPNCGMKSKLRDFKDGCPYCRTYYNIEYTDKDLGSKYYYDLVLSSNKYKVITAIVDIIVSIILSFMFIKITSRTFNSYDVSKIFIYGIILSLVLYYIFYILDAYVVLTPIKKYKEKQNLEQIKFWNRTKIDKKTFFNNLNYEVRKKYYSTDNVIDYDVLDYIGFKDFTKDGKLYVEVAAQVRIVEYSNNKITSKIVTDKYVMKRHENGTLDVSGGANILTCHNCGASIDITKGICEYCRTEIKYLQEWILVN